MYAFIVVIACVCMHAYICEVLQTMKLEKKKQKNQKERNKKKKNEIERNRKPHKNCFLQLVDHN